MDKKMGRNLLCFRSASLIEQRSIGLPRFCFETQSGYFQDVPVKTNILEPGVECYALMKITKTFHNLATTIDLVAALALFWFGCKLNRAI